MTTSHGEETYEGSGRVSVTIERGPKGARWRVRTTDLADEEAIDRVVAQAVAAYGRLERELTGRASVPFVGEEPAAA